MMLRRSRWLDGFREGWSIDPSPPRKPGNMAAARTQNPFRMVGLPILALLMVLQSGAARAVDQNSAQASISLYERGIETAARDDLDGARWLFERAIASNPANARAYAQLGVVHQTKGDPRLARKYYGIALEIDPADLDALSRIAQLDLAEGNREAAAERLRILRFHCETCQQTQELARALESGPVAP